MEKTSTFQDLLRRSGGSAISTLLTDAPKLVPIVETARSFMDQPTAEPTVPENPFTTALRAITLPETDDEEEVPALLTAEEIRIKAQSKTEMWSALLALVISVMNRFVASRQLKKGDETLVDGYERYAEVNGSYPLYPEEHPYYAARERYSAYEYAIDNATADAKLTEDEKDLLGKAIAADLRAKNKKGKLPQASIAETLFEIMVVKSLGPLMSLGLMAMSSTPKSHRRTGQNR